MTARFGFEVLSENGGARRGRLTLAHGIVETPAFMPVGTQGAVKGVTLDQVQALDAEIILGNTYHLHLRPTDALIARAGGLHAFMGWSRPILTDSGGLQEEAPSFGKPVLVMRETTERPEAIDAGCARLVGTSRERIFDAAAELLDNALSYQSMVATGNPFGDGASGRRIAEILQRS